VIVNVLLFLGIAIFGGLSSSWYMVEKGSRLTTRSSGPWTTWTAAGRADADPYTRAHFLRRGMLPASTAVTHSYQALTDSDGHSLYSSCEYIIEGEEPAAAFWSLAVFDDKGGLIPNAAERYSFNTSTVMRPASNRLDVRLARNARPGNWLPTGNVGRLTLLLSLQEPAISDDGPATPLPTIRKVACR
jgi:hypothetical protein